METITLLVSLIGAAAWLPWLFDRFSPTRVAVKTISYTITPKQTFNSASKELKGIGYFLKLNVIALNKTINLKRLEVTVKYPTAGGIRRGNIYWARNATTNIEGKRYKLQIPSEQFLLFASVLEKDKAFSCYLTFIVDKADFEDFEFVTLTFFDFHNRSTSAIIRRDEIDESVMLFEDRLWTPLEN